MLRAMATRSRYISPMSGDYEMVSGNFRADDTLIPSIALALRTRKGSCAVAPWLGSHLFEIRTLRGNVAAQVERHVRDALAHLAPQMKKLAVAVTVIRPSQIHIEINYTSRADSRPALPYTHVMEL